MRTSLTFLARKAKQCAVEETGMYSFLHMWVFLFFLVLSALLINCAEAMVEKMTAQNAADAGSYSAGVVLARSLNAVTASNHLTGELNALVVLHHAFGGYQLDDESDPYYPGYENFRDFVSKGLQYKVWVDYIGAVLTFPSQMPYKDTDLPDIAQDRYDVGATIRDARDVLRAELSLAYNAHALGGILEKIPWTAAIGQAMVRGAYFAEMGLYFEFVFLEKVEDLARSLRSVKKTLEQTIIPLVQVYVKLVQVKAPLDAESIGYETIEEHGASGLIYPSVIKSFSGKIMLLPIEQEKDQLTTNWNLLERSQIVRATWPWVHEWRKPIVVALWIGAPTSLAGMFYENWSKTYTLRKSRQFKERVRQQMMDLHVLKECDITQQEKGQEPWAKSTGSRKADEYFCVLGFGRRIPFRIASGLYDQPNQDGIVAFAQCMVYNANKQTGSTSGGKQPEVGWDTLNWENRVGDYPNSGPKPKIKLNWQAKLVPGTRIDEVSLRLTQGPIGDVIRRLVPKSSLGNTH